MVFTGPLFDWILVNELYSAVGENKSVTCAFAGLIGYLSPVGLAWMAAVVADLFAVG